MREYQKHPMRRRRRLLAFALSLCMAAAALPMPAAAEETPPVTADPWGENVADEFEGGSGTTDDPYLIKNGDQLALLANKINSSDPADELYWSASYKLLGDIDLNSKTWTPIGNVGSTSRTFKGVFDGDGHTIRGLYVSAAEKFCGLFGKCEEAQISNLTVQGDLNMYTGVNYAAIICGLSAWTSFTDCHSKGNVQCYSPINDGVAAGGICGAANNEVWFTGCSNAASVSVINATERDIKAGGICGNANVDSGAFTGCSNTGEVKTDVSPDGSAKTGGVVGSTTCKVTACSNTAAINSENGVAGGICGVVENGITITGSCSTGTVSGQTAGGIAGIADGTVTDCVYKEGCVADTAENVTEAGTSMTAAQIAGGAAAYLMNQTLGDSAAYQWRQQLGTGGAAVPTIQKSAVKAYTVYPCTGCTVKYSNTENQSAEHGGYSYAVAEGSASAMQVKCGDCGTTLGTVTLSFDAVQRSVTAVTDISDATVQAAVETAVIQYYAADEAGQKTGEALAAAPTDVGSYVAELTLTGANEKTAVISLLYKLELERVAPTVTTIPSLGGVYGTKVSELTLTGGEAQVNETSVAGTWSVTDAAEDDYPTVGTTTAYEVTFTPSDTTTYDPVTVTVVPTVTKKPVTVTAENASKKFGEENPEWDYSAANGILVGSDTDDALGVTMSCTATKTSAVGTYPITGTSVSANYDVTIVPGILTIDRASYASKTLTARSYGAAQGGTDSVDLSLYVPADGGTATYGSVTVGGDPVTDAKVTEQGVLSYTVTGGSIGAKTNVAVTVTTKNYEDFTITVPVELTAEAPVKLTQMEAVNGSVTNTTATVRLTADKEGVTYYLYYTTDDSVIVDANTVKSGSSNTTGSFALSGLTRNTTYYVYAAAADANGTIGNICVMQLTTANEDPKPSGGSSSGGGSSSSGGSSSGGGSSMQPTRPIGGEESGKDTGKDDEKENESREPQIRDENGESKKSGWDAIREEVKSAKDGQTVTVQMNGALTVPGKTLQSLKGRDVNVTFKFNNKISLTINGSDLSGFTFKNKNDCSVLFLWTVTSMSRMMRSIGA